MRTNARWLSQDGQTWSEVKNKFRERFIDDDIEEKIHASLKSLRQEDNKTIREYLGRFREWVACSSEVEEAVWYRSWVEGLTRPLHETVVYTGYRDLDDAAKIARQKGRAMRGPTRQWNEGKKEVGSRLGDAQAGSAEALVQMIGEWALQARDMGLRFPTNHRSTIRDGMHQETHELAARYVARNGDDGNVGERCFEGKNRRMEGNMRRPPPCSCYRCGKVGAHAMGMYGTSRWA